LRKDRYTEVFKCYNWGVRTCLAVLILLDIAVLLRIAPLRKDPGWSRDGQFPGGQEPHESPGLGGQGLRQSQAGPRPSQEAWSMVRPTSAGYMAWQIAP